MRKIESMDEMNPTKPVVKACAYKGCDNTILADGEFQYCEVCRSLVLRNSNAILSEPTTPLLERCDQVMDSMCHNMRPDELIAWSHKMEWIYLELRKRISGKEIETYRRTKFAEAALETQTERAKPKTPKVQKKKDSRSDKLAKLLGGTDEAARIMGEDFSDL